MREAYSAGINVDTRVDFEKGIVYDVELMGTNSKNNKVYETTAIREAYDTVEKTGSYIDHPKSEDNNRSIRERFGVFKGPYINRYGILCAREYHYDKTNSFAPSFEWMLKNCPQDIGFSINASVAGYENPATGKVHVSRVLENYGFDLVNLPATTNGIFAVRESLERKLKTLTIREATNIMFPQAFQVGIGELASAVQDGKIDVPAAKKKMNDLFKLIAPESSADAPPADADVMAVEEAYDKAPEGEKEMKVTEAVIKLAKRPALRFLAGRLDAYKVREATEKAIKEKEKVTETRIAKAKAKFAAMGDNPGLITAVFREQLSNAKDDAEVDRLIEDRFTIFNSREQTATGTRFETPVSNPPQDAGVKPAVQQDKEVKDLVASLFG